MPDYLSNPEPVRHISKEKIIIEKNGININDLAQAVANAIQNKLPNNNINLKTEDTFDNSKTLNKLAEQMIVERSGNNSNFNDLGNTVTTIKDKKDIDKTIDLLSNID
jgi:hypothetical protein